MAVVKAFANCADTCTYLQILYNIVVLENNEKLPNCYVRLDVSHFIGHMIARWDCLRGKAAKVRQFYIRSIGHIYKMSEIPNIKFLLTSIMVVALSEDIGCYKNSDLLLTEHHLRSVNDVIKGTSLEDLIDEKENADETSCDALENGWMEWANFILESTKTIAAKYTSGSVVNAFYNPQVAIKLKNLFSYLSLWTGIMHSDFQCDKITATSSAVEATFADLKHRILKGELPMRIDKFIIKHIDSLQAKTLLALADERIACKDTTVENEKNMWNAVKKWRGLTVKNREPSIELD